MKAIKKRGLSEEHFSKSIRSGIIMKKTIKKILAIILCTLTLFGASQSAFAVELTGCAVELPYEHNEDGNYYYLSDENYDYSYYYFYDEVAPAGAMIIDQVQIPFEYEGKNWLIQLWKGQYGMILLGSDIGVFTADKNADGIEDYSFATDDDRLEIKLNCSRKINTEFEELFALDSAKHCFANGYSKGQLTDYTTPLSELKTYSEITFKSEEMAILFANGLKNAGFRESVINKLFFKDSFCRDGSKVKLYWSDINYSFEEAVKEDVSVNVNSIHSFINSFIEAVTVWIVKISSLFTF